MVPPLCSSMVDTQVLRVLVVGLKTSDFLTSAQEVLASSDPTIHVTWALQDSDDCGPWDREVPYDVIIVDCRGESGSAPLPFTSENFGNHGLWLGVGRAEHREGDRAQMVDKMGGCFADLTSASAVLKWGVALARERKKLLGERDDLQRRLDEASYKNEMADVASTVLHNVGNVLTSVLVAANVVESIIDQSSVTLVPRVAGLLKQHEENLGSFLTEDPKGKRILPSMEKLGTHLNDEQQNVHKEIKGLVRNIEHVKQIIASHQMMAKAGGKVELIMLSDLLDHAIELGLHPGDSQWITVRRNYQAVPPVLADRHQILQILVNLIRNAKQAMQQYPRKEGHVLTLGVDREPEAGSFAIVTVQDSGIGIAPEHLSKMFSRGFTTKKDGNGIGLHSSVRALQDMGGSLKVSSDGVGMGATFRFFFPIPEELAE